VAIGKNTAEIIIKAIDQASAILRNIGATGSQQMQKVKKQADLASKGLDYLKTAAAGYLSVVSTRAAYSWLIDTNIQMEQAEIGFETMLGSAAKAKAFLSDLQKFAAKTPFEFTQLREASTRMLAFGFAAEQVLPMLTAVGDATSAMGLGAEGVNRVIIALGQMKAKAKVSADEMLQLTEAGIPAWDILAKAMGKSTAEVMKLSERGLIPADKAIQDIVDGMESRFPGMMNAQSKTLGGMISNLKDWSELAGRTLGKGLFEQIKPRVEGALEYLNKLTQSGQLERWGRDLGNVFAFAVDHLREFLAIAAGAATVFILTKSVEGLSLALTGLRSAELLATVATDGLTKALLRNPFGLVAAGIGLLVGALVMAKTRTVEYTGALSNQTVALRNQYEETSKSVQAKQDEIGVISTQINSLEKLRSDYISLSSAVKAGRMKEEELTVSKQKLAQMEDELVSVVGEATVKRIKSSQDVAAAFGLEVTALQKRKDAQTKILDELTKQERTYTLNLINSITAEIEAVQKSTQAYGTLAKIKLFALQNAPYMGEGAISTFERDAAEVQKAIDSIVKGSHAATLNKLHGELSDLRQKYISLGPAVSSGSSQAAAGMDDLTEATSEAGKAAQETSTAIGSALLSSFSTLAGAVATASASAKVQVREVLQDILADAQKLAAAGAPIGQKLVSGIKDALAMLPQAVYDQTGKAGSKLLALLNSLATQVAGVTCTSLDKIVNAFSLATLEIQKNLDEQKQAYEKAMADIRKINSDAQKAIAEEDKRYYEEREKINQELAEDLRKAYEDYQKDVASVNDKLSDDIKKLWDDFDKLVKEKAKSIGNWLDLFEGAPRASRTASKEKLLAWLQSQVDYMKAYAEAMAQLGQRGIDEGLLKELQEMGPEALPYLQGLLSMTDDELQEYVNLWKEKNQIAGEEALNQLEDTREQFLEQEQQLREEAAAELDRLYQQWQETMRRLNTEADKRLKELKNNWQVRLEEIQNQQKTQLDQILEDAKNFAEQYKQAIEEAVGATPSQPGGSAPDDGQTPDDGGTEPDEGHSIYWPYKEPINQIVYLKGVWASGDEGQKKWAAEEAKQYYAQLPAEIAGLLQGMNYEDALAWKNANVYHRGGMVTRFGPREVPIVAEEGEYIVPKGQRPTLITINGPLVSVGKMEVRSDADIHRVSRELWTLASSNLRALGVR